VEVLSTEDKQIGKLNPEDKLARFRDWLKTCQEAEASQRVREQEDLRFQVAEDQWTQEAKEERAGRPMLSISLIAQPMQLVQNQASAARLSVKISPVSETAKKAIAEMLEGLYQRIQRDGGADQARLWGLDRAKVCGRGWYRIITRYDEDSDNPSDQEIAYQRILYQDMVYADPAAEKPDYSDARFIFVAGYMTCDAFRALYPEAKEYTNTDFLMMEEQAPGWVKVDGKRKDPLVAEVFYKVPIKETKTVPGTGYKREAQRLEVWRAVVTGRDIIEDEPWQGGGIRNIPLIPVIGRELQPVDGQRRWEGMVRPARDGQRTFNYAISSLVEDISRLSKAPYIGAEGQFEGHEDQWRDINRKNVPYVEYKTVSLDGKPVGPPAPMQIDGTKMGLSLQLAQEAKGLVQVATAVYEPSLGNQEGGKDRSGKAILALQQQADAGTGNYVGNLKSISLQYESKVMLELIPRIYDREGRITQVLGEEDEPKTVMLNAPHVMGPDGRPAPPPPPMPGQPQPNIKHYDLSRGGKYSVAPVIGKSAQTRLQEGADELSELIQGLPPDGQMVLLPTYLRFRDGPGMKEAADMMAKLRDKNFPGIAQKEGEQPSSEQLQAQNAALQAQLQEAQQKVAQAADLLKTEQAKQQATIEKAKIDASQAIEIQRMKDATSIAVAKINAAAKGAIQAGELQNENLALAYEISHDEEKTKFDAAHETALVSLQQAHDLEKAKLKMAHEVGMAGAGAHSVTMSRDHGQTNDTETPGEDAGENTEE